ncbi:MAG: IS110 family transposase [Betaproteobacteria bacterium]|jgi:transposase
MQLVFERCCGLDVHKKSLTACLRTPGPRDRRRSETRTFGTTTPELLRLADWLTQNGCTHVAMESTGVYWKPIFNILESVCVVLLVNAHHVKVLPGRKTDVRDCEWIGELLEFGLLKPSFIPPEPIRELRDLTRYRKTLTRERASEANRIQKLLETANIKLASVATDVLGASGRAMLSALVSGERDPEQLAQLAKGTLRAKRGQLLDALSGRFTEHHAFLLGQLLAHVEHLDRAIGECSVRIEQTMRPFSQAATQLETITGVGRRTAECLVAEMGVDMSRFPRAPNLASWTAICPGNNESAGKRRSGRMRKGNVWLKSALVEAAWAASHQRGTYLGALYARIARRRGAKRAVVAVAHAIVIAAWHVLSKNVPYRELGPGHFDAIDKDRLKRRLLTRLNELGYEVTVTAPAA